MTVAFLVMAFGYLLAVIALALFLVECHLGARSDRRIARLQKDLRERDLRLRVLTECNGFLDRQNRALFRRLSTASHEPRQRHCVSTPRRRARSKR